MGENEPDSGTSNRTCRATALAGLVTKATRSAFRRRGMADGTILRDWPAIVGPELARRCVPEMVRYPKGERDGGTLHLRVESGGLATELQHLEPLVVERINGYFGYRAVIALRIHQGPLPASREIDTKPVRPLDEAEIARVDAAVAAIQDDDLRRVLTGLGRAVAARRRDERGS